MIQKQTNRLISLAIIVILTIAGGYILFENSKEKQAVRGAQSQSQTHAATLSVKDQKYSLIYTQGESLEQSLTKLAKTSRNFTIETKQYNFGAMVVSVNGIKAEKNEFWKLKINEKDSVVGISDYKLNSGDNIELTLEKITF